MEKCFVSFACVAINQTPAQRKKVELEIAGGRGCDGCQ